MFAISKETRRTGLMKMVKLFQLKFKIILYVGFIVSFFVVGYIHKESELDRCVGYIVV